MSRDHIDTLFKQYEKSFDKLDMRALSGYCADSFMSAGPKGTITQSKEQYEKKGEEAVKFYRSVGWSSARIISKRMMPISDCYAMVVIRWGLAFERTGSKLMEFDITYIVQLTGTDPKIILMISHEDEEVAMKKLGVLAR